MTKKEIEAIRKASNALGDKLLPILTFNCATGLFVCGNETYSQLHVIFCDSLRLYTPDNAMLYLVKQKMYVYLKIQSESDRHAYSHGRVFGSYEYELKVLKIQNYNTIWYVYEWSPINKRVVKDILAIATINSYHLKNVWKKHIRLVVANAHRRSLCKLKSSRSRLPTAQKLLAIILAKLGKDRYFQAVTAELTKRCDIENTELVVLHYLILNRKLYRLEKQINAIKKVLH